MVVINKIPTKIITNKNIAAQINTKIIGFCEIKYSQLEREFTLAGINGVACGSFKYAEINLYMLLIDINYDLYDDYVLIWHKLSFP